LAYTDYVLLMSVDPGFTGQAYLPHIGEKLRFLAHYRREQGLSFRIMVDGGITDQHIQPAHRDGADEVVMGQYFFRQPDWLATLKNLCGVMHAPT
jgi:ribulose-phosphate 3-epimerase